MEQNWKNRWNERYSKKEFAYGEEPNNYLKRELDKLKVGTILFPAEGEGRNAVYAAKMGWNVLAFDISDEGKKKALQFATSNNVKIDYEVGELETLDYKKDQFDVIALIYAHFPADIKSYYHTVLNTYLRKGGILIFEAFSKSHLDFVQKDEKIGGPKDIDSLFSIAEIQSDFPDYDFEELTEIEIELNEGLFHNGKGSVIRCVGRKK
jgi:SAM-dependent methyltransferase